MVLIRVLFAVNRAILGAFASAFLLLFSSMLTATLALVAVVAVVLVLSGALGAGAARRRRNRE